MALGEKNGGNVAPFESLVECLDGPSYASCVASSALLATFTVMLIMAMFCYAASAITNNDSWVDRLWSIVPVVHTWIFFAFQRASSGGVVLWNSPALVFAVLVTFWGLRLTYNFYRKGGYRRGGEDYRWLHVRSWPVFQASPRVVWHLFSFIIISAFQSWLLWAITLPLSKLPTHLAATVPDYVFAAAFIFFLALETLTDQQQWGFQNEKRGLLPRHPAVNYNIGFCVDGVFAYSRHMNVWSEQSLWVTVFLAGASHASNIYDPTFLGCAVLILLTVGSTSLTEAISAKKYPAYAVFQQSTPMLLPALQSREQFTKYLIEKRGL